MDLHSLGSCRGAASALYHARLKAKGIMSREKKVSKLLDTWCLISTKLCSVT